MTNAEPPSTLIFWLRSAAFRVDFWTNRVALRQTHSMRLSREEPLNPNQYRNYKGNYEGNVVGIRHSNQS